MTTTAKLQKIKCDFSDVDLYNPVYIPLFENKSRFLHLWGSAGSGKSVFASQKEIVLSFDWARRKRKTLVIRKVKDTIKESVYSELKGVISDWDLDDYFDILKSPLLITNKLTGVEFIFFGLDDVGKLKSIRGIDRCLIEEATDLERNDLDQLDFRLRGFEEIQYTLNYNPVDEYHWLNTEIHHNRPEDHFFFHTTYKDNQKLLAKDPNYARRIESKKETNPNYYRVYGEGLWGRVVEGLIYSEFDIIKEFPKNDKGEDDIHHYGLDFGFSDPTALVAQHVQDALPKKNLINKQILYKTGLDGVGLVREFDALGVRKDITITADSARPEMIKSLTDAGYKCKPSEKGAGSVLTGINRVRAYRLQIVAGSKEVIKEAQNYQKKEVNGAWHEEPAPNQVEHGMDAIRYGEQEQTAIVVNLPKRRSVSTNY